MQSACVIYNPAAGRGRARRLIATLDPQSVLLLPTQYPGHARTLAEERARAGTATIIAAGGDGTVHEVAEGILNAGPTTSALAIWPIGSANDYAHALGIKPALPFDLKLLKGDRLVDVGRISAGSRSAYFINCLGVGFNAAVTLESRKIKWLRGMALYGLGTLKALIRHFDQPILTTYFDDVQRQTATLALSVNLGIREGNFPVTPAALLDDGLFDMVQAGPLTRWQAFKLLPKMAGGTLPSGHPGLWIGRAKRVSITSPVPLRIHLDGEFFCHPEDGIAAVAIELLPLALRVRVTS